jgi:hypothetical protein
MPAPKTPKTAKVEKHHLRGSFDVASLNFEKRTIDVTFATETTDVQKYDWRNSTYFIEVLVCDKESVRMDRINSGAPFLDNHRAYGSVGKDGGILGVIERATIENGVGKATLRFSKRAEIDPILNDVKDGILTNVSVGYNVHVYERGVIVDGETPTYRAIDWEPFEISLVTIPADIKAKVRASKNKTAKQFEVELRTIDNNNPNPTLKNPIDMELKARALAVGLPETATEAEVIAAERKKEILQARALAVGLTKNATEVEIATAEARNINHAANAAVIAERARVSEITGIVRAAKINDSEFLEKLISEGNTVDQARAATLDALVKGSVTLQNTVDVTGPDEKENERAAVSVALEFRANPKTKIEGKALDYRGMSLLDMARMYAEKAGVKVRGLSAREVASEGLGMTRSGQMGTSDFPIILGNTIHRVLRKEYELYQPTFLPFCQQGTAKDFRTMTKAQMGEVGKMKEVAEGGEYTNITVGEAKEAYAVKKYGSIIPFTWESIINDDLGAFNRIPKSIAVQARQLQSDIVYGLLSTNSGLGGLMGDGIALFDASGHGNYTASGTAINVANLQIGRKAIRTQKGINGTDFLNLVPKYLVVGPANEQLAYQYTSSVFVPTKNSDINPVYNTQLTVIIDPRLTSTEWYLVADPNQIDTIEYSFLEGDGELFTERRLGFEVDGLEIKARMVFGAKAIDWRGFYKNLGA